MAVLGSLYVELKATVDPFIADLKRVQKEADESTKYLKPLKETAQDLGEVFTVAGGAITTAFAFALKSAADFGDEMHDMAMKTGLTTEALSGLKLAAETNGSNIDALAGGIEKMSKNMELAISGSKQQQRAFEALGITTKDLKDAHGDVQQIMLKVADAFSTAQDGAGKTAIAMQLMGRSGAELIPTLNEGSAGLAKWADEAERTGRVISTEAAAAADKFHDDLTVLQESVTGLAGSVGNDLIPPLTKLVVETTNIVQGLREWTAAHPDLVKFIGLLGVGLTGVGGVLLGVTAVVAILPQLTVAFTILTGPIALVSAAIIALGVAAYTLREEITAGLMVGLSDIVFGLEKFLGAVRDVASAVGATGLSGMLDTAVSSLQNYQKGLDDSVNAGNVFDRITGLNTHSLGENKSATDDSADSLKQHTLALLDNGEAAKKMQEALTAATKRANEDVAKTLQEMQHNLELELKYEDDLYDKQVKNRITLDNAYLRAFDVASAARTKTLQQEADDYEKILKNRSDVLVKDLDKQLEIENQQLESIKRGQEENAAYIKKTNKEAGDAVGKLWDDVVIKGQGVFTSLKQELTGGALSIGKSLVEDITGALIGPIKRAFEDFFKNTLESIVQGWLSQFGKDLGETLAGGKIGSGGGFSGGFANILGSILSFIPFFDTGTPRLKQNTLAFVHKDEAIVPAANNPFNPTASAPVSMPGGGDGETKAVLMQILAVLQQGGDIYLDGMKVGRAVGPALYKLNRFEGLQIQGAQ